MPCLPPSIIVGIDAGGRDDMTAVALLAPGHFEFPRQCRVLLCSSELPPLRDLDFRRFMVIS